MVIAIMINLKKFNVKVLVTLSTTTTTTKQKSKLFRFHFVCCQFQDAIEVISAVGVFFIEFLRLSIFMIFILARG